MTTAAQSPSALSTLRRSRRSLLPMVALLGTAALCATRHSAAPPLDHSYSEALNAFILASRAEQAAPRLTGVRSANWFSSLAINSRTRRIAQRELDAALSRSRSAENLAASGVALVLQGRASRAIA